MKQAILLPFLSMAFLPANKQLNTLSYYSATGIVSIAEKDKTGFSICSQPSPENEKMLAVVFRAQDFCRAELKDFEFDVHFNVVSATVYFSGPGFKNVETGFIKSNSLKPIRSLMDRCMPGSMVVFDNVKVKGPDNLVRPVQGTSYLLH